jgi:hypothetical protein
MNILTLISNDSAALPKIVDQGCVSSLASAIRGASDTPEVMSVTVDLLLKLIDNEEYARVVILSGCTRQLIEFLELYGADPELKAVVPSVLSVMETLLGTEEGKLVLSKQVRE